MKVVNDYDKLCTPYSNRGYTNTEVNKLNACVDWLRLTFFTNKNEKEITQFLGLDFDDFVRLDTGKYYYKKRAVLGHISIFWEGSSPNMGIMIEMTGQGCREYESYMLDTWKWSDLFAKVNYYFYNNWNCSRIDLALDDYTGILNIKKMWSLAKRGCLVAQGVNVARYIEEIELRYGKTLGQTFYIGKKPWQIRFYDKKQERIKKGQPCPFDFWNRYELQLSMNLAKQAVEYLIQPDSDIGNFIKSIFYEKLDFKIKDRNDSNRARWKTQKFWLEFLEDVEKIEFVKKERSYTVEKTFSWLDKQTAASIYFVSKAIDDDELLLNYLYELGKIKMSETKESMIRDFENNADLKKSIRLYMQSEIRKMNKKKVLIIGKEKKNKNASKYFLNRVSENIVDNVNKNIQTLRPFYNKGTFKKMIKHQNVDYTQVILKFDYKENKKTTDRRKSVAYQEKHNIDYMA